jgi:hypothetical protein
MSDAEIELELYLGEKLYLSLADTAQIAIFWGRSLLPLLSYPRLLIARCRHSCYGHHCRYHVALVGENATSKFSPDCLLSQRGVRSRVSQFLLVILVVVFSLSTFNVMGILSIRLETMRILFITQPDLSLQDRLMYADGLDHNSLAAALSFTHSESGVVVSSLIYVRIDLVHFSNSFSLVTVSVVE